MTNAAAERRAKTSEAIGASVGLAFGGLWWSYAGQMLPRQTTGWALLVGATITALLIVRAWRAPGATAMRRKRFGWGVYFLAVGLEVAAIVAANAFEPRFGLEAYHLQIVGAIVGLHFIGLWAATGMRRFLAVAAAMCALSSLAMLAPAGGAINVRDIATGAGNALALWVGASWRSAEKESAYRS